MRRAALTLLAALGLAASEASRLPAQVRTAVLHEPATAAVGVALVLDAGTAWETDEELGLTHLAARAALEEVRPRLDALGARATLACDEATLSYTLVAPVDAWAIAAGLLLDGVLRREPGSAAIERARAALTEAMMHREGSPAHAARLALRRAVYGAGNRWARPPCGTVETLAGHSADAVRRRARARLLSGRATAAVAGAVDTLRARRLLDEALGDPALPVLVPVPHPPPPFGSELRFDRTVTAWAELAFPLRPPSSPANPDGAPPPEPEALRMLAFLLEDTARPGPERPDIHDASASVRRHGARGALIVRLVTEPASAAGWLGRVGDRVRELAGSPLPAAAFEPLRRRYAGARLRDLAGPEDRALDAALQLYHLHRYTPPARSIRRLAPTDLQRAAASLGDPAVAVVGPVLPPEAALP